MVNSYYIPRGLTARISGFHPEGPGSTPGVGSTFLIATYFSHSTFWSGNELYEKVPWCNG